jgi:hypothetical protein
MKASGGRRRRRSIALKSLVFGPGEDLPEIGAGAEVGALIADDEAAEAAELLEARDRLAQHGEHAVVEDVHARRVEVDAGDAVAEIDEAGGGGAVEEADLVRAGVEQEHAARGVAGARAFAGDKDSGGAGAAAVPAGVFALRGDEGAGGGRGLFAEPLELAEAPGDADGVPEGEGAELPAVAPDHGLVDLLGGVADLAEAAGGVVEEGEVHGAEEVADAPRQAQGGAHPAGEVADLGDLGELGELRGLRGAVLEGGEIERLDHPLAALAGRLAVEAAAGLVAEALAPQHLRDQRGDAHEVVQGVVVGGLRISAEGVLEVLDDVGDDVEPDHVAEAVGAGARATHEGAVELIDLFDGEAAGGGGGEGEQHLGDADAVADEVRGVAADDHALAEHAIGEVDELGDHRGIAVRGRDDLEQVHVARRVEEVHAAEATTRGLGQALGDRGDRDAAGVRGEHGVRGRGGGDPGEELLLDVEALDDGLDHEIAGGDGSLEVVLKIADADPRGRG